MYHVSPQPPHCYPLEVPHLSPSDPKSLLYPLPNLSLPVHPSPQTP